MTKQDFRMSISTPTTAYDAYDKIAAVADWWAKDFSGSARNVGDTFTVCFGQTFVDFKVAEAVPGPKMVWHVVNCFIHRLNDKTEWNGTNVVFEMASRDEETTVTMTHEGLVPESECFAMCEQGWNQHFGQSLLQLLTEGYGKPKETCVREDETRTMIRDTIERKITLRAPKERVYEAITDPKKIVTWFPDTIEGTLEVGARPIVDFGGEYKYQLYVVAANPHDYFAYRWVPGNADGSNGFMGDVLAVPNTLVEFRLADDRGGTVLTLMESGFSTLPAAVAARKLEENSEGWDYMLDRLEKLIL